MKATNIRKGNVLKVNNGLYRVMSMNHITPGKGQAIVQTKLRNLLDGTQTEIYGRTGNYSRFEKFSSLGIRHSFVIGYFVIRHSFAVIPSPF